MNQHQKIIETIFASQGSNGCWKMLEESNRNYPACLHYSPTYKSTVWTLILLADLQHDPVDERVKLPLNRIQEHFYDPKSGIYSLGKDHFPIPCLNGNMIYLDAWFNRSLSEKSESAVNFFSEFQRFDDGTYQEPGNRFCSNTSCFGKHTCYWGVVKLLKGLSFIPKENRNEAAQKLLNRCIEFVLLHRVCFSSRNEGKYLSRGIDKLVFPCMYQSNFLEILWLLKREDIRSENILPAIQLLKSKQQPEGNWNLEKKISNMVASVGAENKPNEYITKRAIEVLEFYQKIGS
ncbi:MAG: hypothetical protein WC384_11195 [Prolixibacteraceae bacterium]|jgi:hypothetical protein